MTVVFNNKGYQVGSVPYSVMSSPITVLVLGVEMFLLLGVATSLRSTCEPVNGTLVSMMTVVAETEGFRHLGKGVVASFEHPHRSTVTFASSEAARLPPSASLGSVEIDPHPASPCTTRRCPRIWLRSLWLKLRKVPLVVFVRPQSSAYLHLWLQIHAPSVSLYSPTSVVIVMFLTF